MRRISLAAAVCIFAALVPPTAAEEALDAAQLRARLVHWITLQVSAASAETGIGELDPRVLETMAEVPRHAFVPEPLRSLAYLDMALPVGHGQNISQPFIVALMTHLARVGVGDVVFETGTGAGYQAAILSRLARRVYSVAMVETLGARAAATLERLGYDNVEVRLGDGYYGWPDGAPYDAIIVKEAIHHVPPPLLKQLKPGGRMVIPVGPADGVQQLTLVEKDASGRWTQTLILPVRFSPLQGGERI